MESGVEEVGASVVGGSVVGGSVVGGSVVEDSVVGGSVGAVELVGPVELDVGEIGLGVVGAVIDIFTATKSMDDCSGSIPFSVA